MAERKALLPAALVAAGNVLIFQHYVPNIADIRTAQPFNNDVEKSERSALYTATGFTLLVSFFARSLEIFAVGGAVIVAMDYAVKHANAVNPQTGAMDTQTATSFPMPDYQS